MIFNTALDGALSKGDRELWLKVLDAVMVAGDQGRKLPKHYSGVTVECHSICRGLAMHISGLKLVDGHYIGLDSTEKEGGREFEIRHCDHSWLETPSGAIIDPYPVGFLATNPIVIPSTGKYLPFAKGSYVPSHSVTSKIATRKTHRKSLFMLRLIRDGFKSRSPRA